MRLSDHFQKYQRRKLLNRASSSAMSALLTSELPNSRSLVANTGYVVADLEMTGLDARRDQVLSIGWVLIENNQILNVSAKHFFLRAANADLTQSAPIHKIRDIDLIDAAEPSQVLDFLLTDLCARALVLHCANLDLAFLNSALRDQGNVGLNVPVIDTMQVERKRIERQGLGDAPLNLSACRHRYGLPSYTAHNAAIDALATAELWLAQLAHGGCSTTTRLGYYLSR